MSKLLSNSRNRPPKKSIFKWFKDFFGANDFSKESIRQQYLNTPTLDLLFIVDRREHYSSVAIEAIIEILRERGCSEQDKNDFIHAKVMEDDLQFRKSNFEDISFTQKLFIFVVPFYNIIYYASRKSRWTSAGFDLKVSQARYYFNAGYGTFFCNIIILGLTDSLLIIFTIELASFITFSYFDWKRWVQRKRWYDNIYADQTG